MAFQILRETAQQPAWKDVIDFPEEKSFVFSQLFRIPKETTV
jgi:hypothetical protein